MIHIKFTTNHLFKAVLLVEILFILNVRSSVQAGSGQEVKRKSTFDSEYPFFTAIWENGEHICGGSILTKDMILTAAHCVANVVNPNRLTAYFGISTKEEAINKVRFYS